MKRGFVLPIPAIIIALVGIIAIVVAWYSSAPREPESGQVVPEEQVTTPSEDSGATTPNEKPSVTSGSSAKPQQSSPPAATPSAPTPAPGTSSGSSSTTPAAPVPEPQAEPTPAPTAWSPGFKADSRVTPEIPSENERATLPSCEGKVFTIDPVNLGIVSSISATGKTGTVSSSPSDFAILRIPGGSDLYHYDVVAPGDVYVTHIAQEFGITRDPDDTTIYFALCRDVIGYIKNIKELSDAMYKIVTDSSCFGKPHVGENACHIKVLQLIGGGSLLGKVGEIEGAFGFGVIDLRKQRSLADPSQYAIKTNFAACPLSYLANPAGFFAKLDASSDLCTKP